MEKSRSGIETLKVVAQELGALAAASVYPR